ncbi:hypothetical protein GOP47_0004657 [Adiantum capillus-veneris]|uniref:UVR domain-containing protein n=1 Tax=Adiantum capillus-veneris TaxID=13818 RepID=A0A9D4ZN07_ADICA|nr:hypothetical protein GOP47_0004657 [Adiantum capillus-veneris]
MEREDDMDSLFAGMEFVNPLDAESPLSPQHSSPAPLDLNSFSDQIQLSRELPTDPKPEASDKANIDSILAAYDSARTKVQPSMVSLPTLHKQGSDASKPGVRRKRRSVKIGYGRSNPDDADEVRSASGQDETASNGSAVDEQSSGFLEVISAPQDGISASRNKSLISSITNGDLHVVSFGGVDAKHEEPFENLTVFTERLDIAEAELPISKDVSLGLSLDDDVVLLREAESGGAIILRKESPEYSSLSLQPTLPDECLRMDDVDPSVEVVTIQTPSSERTFEEGVVTIQTPSIEEGVVMIQTPSSERASDFASQERHIDAINLQIKVPLHLTIEERFSFIRTALSMNAECIQKRISTISQSRKAAAQKRRQVREIVTRSTLEFKEVEEEIQAACEREDFEKAEQLDEALVLAQKAKEAAMEEFIAVEAEYDKYASNMHEEVQLLITSEEEGFSLLEQLRQDAADTAKDRRKDSEDVVKIRTEELLANEVNIKVEKEKLMLEIQKVEDAKMELSCRIKSSVHGESKEKQRLEEERHVLLQELDALLAAVRLKETQIAEHDKKIGDLEKKINNSVTGLEQEKVKMEAVLYELASDLDHLDRESKSLDERRKQVEAEGICAQEAAQKLLELSSIVKAEAEKLQDAILVRKAAAKVALSSKEKRLSLATQEKQHVEDANCFRDQTSSLRTSLQELASEKVKLQQESLSATQQISSIEKRLPEVEAEKKLAAGSRNFKEAGRLAAEAKALLSNKERKVAESRRVTKDLQVLEQELEIRTKDLTDLESQLRTKEKTAAKARYERLRLLAAATRDERDAASELEDFEEAKSLDVEAAAADKEADDIQNEFGFDVQY